MIGRAIALELLKNNEVFQSKVEDLQVSVDDQKWWRISVQVLIRLHQTSVLHVKHFFV